MLKKLVKYGNSNALVLDKALLELLNITEGSVVKIKTDGTSLIITPQDDTPAVVSPTITSEVSLKKAINEHVKQMPNPELEENAIVRLTAAFNKVHEKYNHVLQLAAQLAENPEYIDKSVLLAEKYQATKNSPEYLREQKALIASYIPEYADYEKALAAVATAAQ